MNFAKPHNVETDLSLRQIGEEGYKTSYASKELVSPSDKPFPKKNPCAHSAHFCMYYLLDYFNGIQARRLGCPRTSKIPSTRFVCLGKLAHRIYSP